MIEDAIYQARIMGYSVIIGNSQLAIANSGAQTQITLNTSSSGQQQSQSSSFSTGKWLNKPKLFQSRQGLILQVEGEQGIAHILLQHNSISSIKINAPSDLDNCPLVNLEEATTADQTLKPMQPLEPLQPLKMGNMSMDINSMSMQMGNMSMGFGNQQQTNPTKKFCSQCGVEAKAGDRFCRSCGHELAQ